MLVDKFLVTHDWPHSQIDFPYTQIDFPHSQFDFKFKD